MPKPSARRPAHDDSAGADILVFVAFDRERNAVLAAARAHGYTPEEGRHPELGKYRSLALIRGRRVWMVRAKEIGAIGAGGSARLALRWLAASGASTIIQVGMAFGVDPTTQTIGDVLVASHLFPYDLRTVREEPPGTVVVDYTARHLEASPEFLLHLGSLPAPSLGSTARVHLGAILTGNSKIFSANYRDALAEAATHPGIPVVGGEMEGLGLLSASSPDNPNWNLVKGISDFADGQSPDAPEFNRRRTLACENAASLVFDVLERYPDNKQIFP